MLGRALTHQAILDQLPLGRLKVLDQNRRIDAAVSRDRGNCGIYIAA